LNKETILRRVRVVMEDKADTEALHLVYVNVSRRTAYEKYGYDIKAYIVTARTTAELESAIKHHGPPDQFVVGGEVGDI